MKRYVYIISLLLCICGLCRAQRPFQTDSPRLFEYSNDTIRQSVEVSLLDDSGISFKLTTENKLRKKTAIKQGVATNKQKDFGASETDEDETGSLYPVVEYTYEGDCWIAFRFDEKYGRLRIKEADNEKPVPGCPLKSVGVLAVKKEKTSIKNLESDTLYVERIESLDDNRDILYINRNGKRQLVYELFTTDCSSIDYIGSHQENGKKIFDCYGIYNNAADGNNFLFYDYRNSTVYLTKACFFSSFRLLMSSVDFNKRQVLLENDSCIPNQTVIDTLDVGSVRPGGFAIRCSLSIRIYNPPYNYPLCRSRIENPNTQIIGLQIRLNGVS